MPLCINQAGTYRNITTLCINQAGTYRNIVTGCINQAGTYRRFGFTFSPALGSSFGGGFLICKQAPNLRWVVSPFSAQVSRTWHSRNDAATRAQQVSGCTGWFVPTRPQLQNPGFICRGFWDLFSDDADYWSSTSHNAANACRVDFYYGNADISNKSNTNCVRAFRCVTY